MLMDDEQRSTARGHAVLVTMEEQQSTPTEWFETKMIIYYLSWSLWVRILDSRQDGFSLVHDLGGLSLNPQRLGTRII